MGKGTQRPLGDNPSRVSRCVTKTQELWQRRYAESLSENEAIFILGNVSDCFSILDEWDRQSAATSSQHGEESHGQDHTA